eukprot:351002-Chlamydomonas_euryale.AAC.5
METKAQLPLNMRVWRDFVMCESPEGCVAARATGKAAVLQNPPQFDADGACPPLWLSRPCDPMRLYVHLICKEVRAGEGCWGEQQVKRQLRCLQMPLKDWCCLWARSYLACIWECCVSCTYNAGHAVRAREFGMLWKPMRNFPRLKRKEAGFRYRSKYQSLHSACRFGTAGGLGGASPRSSHCACTRWCC